MENNFLGSKLLLRGVRTAAMTGTAVLILCIALGCSGDPKAAQGTSQAGSTTSDQKPGPEKTPPPTEGWTSIAVVQGNDQLTQIHVKNLLAGAGIDAAMEGSTVYGVSVPSAHAEKARSLLKDDAKRGIYWIRFDDGTKHAGLGSGESVRIREFDAPLAEVLKRRDVKDHAVLWAALNHEAVRKASAKTAHLAVVLLSPRSLAGPKGGKLVGWNVEVRLQPETLEGKGGATVSLQVWDEGQKTAFLGAGQWDGGSQPK